MADSVLDRIAAADPAHADTIATHDSAVAESAVPFWTRFRLVRVRTMLPHRPLDLRYADDGQRAIQIGYPAGLYAANKADGLTLDTPGMCAAYLRFWFEDGGERLTYLAESPDRMPWFRDDVMTDDDRAEQRAAVPWIRPMVVTVSPRGGFDAEAIAVCQRELLRLRLHVAPDGTVTVISREQLRESIPVPYVMP